MAARRRQPAPASLDDDYGDLVVTTSVRGGRAMGSHWCASPAGQSGVVVRHTSAREEAVWRCRSVRGGAQSRQHMAEPRHIDQGGGTALHGCFIDGTGGYSGVTTMATE
jgi:hypothetical protein